MNAIPPFVECWASAQDRSHIAAVTYMAMSIKAVLANMFMLRELFQLMYKISLVLYYNAPRSLSYAARRACKHVVATYVAKSLFKPL